MITAILDITDSELKEDLLQSLMDSLGSNKHVLPEVCICFLSLLAEQESPHFQNLFLFFANMLLHYHQFMNPNESDLNDVLMPASLSDDKIIKHMARRTLKLFVKMKHRQSYSRRHGEKQASLPCQTTYTRNRQNARPP